ncbi:exosome complex component CSL4 [Candida albicans P75010]|nr:exosome complex component CSL4 [Candida albicans P37039]KHC68550.1 exosome complex component CSL4 [Candida albicans P75010]
MTDMSNTTTDGNVSSIVVPGQYISPTYKLENSNNDSSIPVKYIPGSGTIISNINIPSPNTSTNSVKSMPIIVSTILGNVSISPINQTPTSKPSNNDDMVIDNEQTKSDEDKDKDKYVKSYLVSVIPKSTKHQSTTSTTTSNQSGSKAISAIALPKENDIVLVRITKITKIQAYCEIISLDTTTNILPDSGLGNNGNGSHVSMSITGSNSQHNFNQNSIASSQSTNQSVQIYELGENFKGIIRINDIRSTERDKLKLIDCFKPGDIVKAQVISLGDGSNYYLTTAKNELGVVFAKSENGAGDLMYPIDWQNMIDINSGVIEKRKNANPFLQ